MKRRRMKGHKRMRCGMDETFKIKDTQSGIQTDVKRPPNNTTPNVATEV